MNTRVWTPSAAYPTRDVLLELDRTRSPITTRSTDYAAGASIGRHQHGRHQLVHAVHGVMLVSTEAGQWIVPPTRALWMPAGLVHSVDCIGVVHMRSIYVRPGAVRGLSRLPQVVGVSALLRELIQAATRVRQPYVPNSRDGRVMRLLLDEMRALPVLPLHLPQPADPRLRRICDRLAGQPDDASTLTDWGRELGLDRKTIERLFVRDTGMTFGRWRQQCRLLRALERLARGDRIVDIALDLGYESPGAFATMFRRQFGRPPSRFFDPVDPVDPVMPVGAVAPSEQVEPARRTTPPARPVRST